MTAESLAVASSKASRLHDESAATTADRGERRSLRLLRAAALPAITVLVLLGGALLHFTAAGPGAASRLWLAGLILTGSPVVLQTVRGLARGHFAADVVASLAI